MHTADEVNPDRRRFLTNSAIVIGAVGAGFVAVPFLASWSPSERVKAAGAPVEVDISKLEEGALLVVEWRGKPVWILRRKKDMMASLEEVTSELRDPNSDESNQPDYAKNVHRSRDDQQEVLVMLGVCTHLGCSPKYRIEPDSEVGSNWRGGFFCPCHGSKFDLAGRVFTGVPAPTNLDIPRYKYLDEARTQILVGDDSQEQKESA